METIEHIAPSELRPSPLNPRKHLGNLDELAVSMKTVGVLEPLIARWVGKVLELVCGHRRNEAAKLAELPTGPSADTCGCLQPSRWSTFARLGTGRWSSRPVRSGCLVGFWIGGAMPREEW